MGLEKQISDMARIISPKEDCGDCQNCRYLGCCSAELAAANLYHAGYKRSEWISVDDRLPESDGKYLVCTQSEKVFIARFYGGVFCCFSDESRVVTHWMALPELPEK